MNKDLLLFFIEETLNDRLEWNMTSNPFEFYAYLDGIRYSVESSLTSDGVNRYVVNKWNDKGEPEAIYLSGESESDIIKDLYLTILKRNEDLNVRYNNYLNKMNIEKAEKDRSYMVSLYKVMSRLGFESKEERPYIRIKESDSFYYKDEDKDGLIIKYVQPPMSQIPTTKGMTPYQEAEVILISAPGATGKTAMSEYISFMLKIPILNLGFHEAVGANSISGLIMTQVEKEDIFKYHSGLSNGSCAMVIDGLDEASIHITQDSFEAFLKDVAFFAKDSSGLPFVILGRPSVMEDAALALEEDNGVKVSLLQIEPFTVEKAMMFIDNQLPKDYVQRYEKQYKEVRDYIIEQIGGFFRNESEMNKRLFEHFIGYAPVLQSISNLLNEKLDYHKLLDELKENRKQKIELLIDIVRRVLSRERKKICDEVLPQLFDGNYSIEFKKTVEEKCAKEDEQCERILCRVLNKEVFFPITGDKKFDERYNEKVSEWMKNHPFLKGNEKKIQNIVFESFIIANFIENPRNQKNVLDYLSKTDSGSYLLLDIYSTINRDEIHETSHLFFPYLYKSFKALDHPNDIGITEIISDDDTNGNVCCYLNFCRKALEYEYDFVFKMSKEDVLRIPSPTSSLVVDAPIRVQFYENKVDIQAPVTITCKGIDISTKDVLFSTPTATNGIVVFACDDFTAQCSDGSMPSLIFRTPKENNRFIVLANATLYYPFSSYSHPIQNISTSRNQINVAYQKLRRMMLMFRAHNKGSLARYCSKIDNRIGRSELGKTIIQKLMSKGVLSSDGLLYYINSDKFAEVLGMKYDDFRSSTVNEKTKTFIESLFEKGNK